MLYKTFLVSALAAVFVTGVFAAKQIKVEKKNLIDNPGFEKVDEIVIGTNDYLQRTRKQGCNLADGPIAVLPSEWVLQGSSGKIRVVEGKPGKNIYSGKHALFMSTSKDTQMDIYSGSFVAGPTYIISVYARGKGAIYLRTYEYKNTTGGACVGAPMQTFKISDNWTKYEWIYNRQNPDAKFFNVVVGVMPGSNAYLDDVELLKKNNLK
ncbi:MAG: hypothetical protein M1501_01735 [Candidatus Omnitrophica bacterium]|nr:hypothetical protein [Candidatus Omnitrophota bacterium]